MSLTLRVSVVRSGVLVLHSAESRDWSRVKSSVHSAPFRATGAWVSAPGTICGLTTYATPFGFLAVDEKTLRLPLGVIS